MRNTKIQKGILFFVLLSCFILSACAQRKNVAQEESSFWALNFIQGEQFFAEMNNVVEAALYRSVLEEIQKVEEAKNAEILAYYDGFAEPVAFALYGDKTVYQVKLTEVPESDDGKAYLYALMPYEYGVEEEMKPLLQLPLEVEMRCEFPLNFDTEATNLYRKFCLCIKQNGSLKQITDAKYIVNPEILAKYTRAYEPIEKGLQSECLQNLFLDGTGQDQGIEKPAVCLLASLNPYCPTVHPSVWNTDSHPMGYYMFMLNGDTAEGVSALARDCSAIAAAGGQNFVIANEVNERVWNYEPFSSWEEYVRDYTQAFRVCYNAIKSQNANARVFISIGQDWDRNRAKDHEEYYRYIDEKDFCDLFNEQMLAEGNVDWGITLHPYIVPLTYSKFWDMADCPAGGYCKAQVDRDAMVSFQNMSVITDYLTKEAFLNPGGEPRYFVIGEMGLSTGQGDEVQAAALCALWAAYKQNPYIKELLYCDLAGYGVDPTLIGKSLEVWEALGTDAEEEYMSWALSYIGIEDWNEVIR